MNAIARQSAVPVSGPKLDNRRMLAALIDLLVVTAGGAAILAAAGVLGGDGAEVSAPLAAVVVCWALYYSFACESGGGQTLGKRLLRIRVVRTDGSPAGTREIAIRTVLRVVDMQFAYLVGLIAMLATGERRGRLGDLAAGTMIVSSEGAAAPPPEPMPDLTSPSLEELARDVAAAAGTARWEEAAVEEAAPPGQDAETPVEEVAHPADQAEADRPELTVKSIETVSAIDLVMGGDEPRAGEAPANEPRQDAGPE